MVAEGSWLGRVPMRVRTALPSEMYTLVPGSVWLEWRECGGYERVPPEARKSPSDPYSRVVQRERRLLIWTEDDEAPRSSEGCLFEFLRLKGQGEEAILDFARRWGCLSNCPLTWTEDGQKFYAEPIEDWNRTINYYLAVLLTATRAELDVPIEPRIHSMLLDGTDDPEFVVPKIWAGELASAEDARSVVSSIVNAELQHAHVQPVLAWGDIGPATIRIGTDVDRLRMARRGWDNRRQTEPMVVGPWAALDNSRPSLVRAALAVQLASALTHDAMVAACSLCDRVYLPERRPRQDKGRYCSDDCRDEAHRQVLRESYRRRKERRGKEEGRTE